MASIFHRRGLGEGGLTELSNTPIAGDLTPDETAFNSGANTFYRGQSDGSIIVYTQSSTITDTQDPVAALFGSLPGVSTGETGTIAIDYTDNVGINLSTLGNSSLTVADGGTNATVILQSTSPINSGKGYRALFNVTPPSAGTYGVTVEAGYEDLAGNTGAAVSLGNMVVLSAPGTIAPTATLVGALPTAITGVAATVTVDFDDETAFNPASVTIGSLSAVDGANVATIAIANTTTIGNNGVRVDFDVTAPADGSYTVTVPVNSYADAAGNQGALVNLGTMIASPVSAITASLGAALNPVEALPTFQVVVNFVES